jgi:hypothetical protein
MLVQAVLRVLIVLAAAPLSSVVVPCSGDTKGVAFGAKKVSCLVFHFRQAAHSHHACRDNRRSGMLFDYHCYAHQMTTLSFSSTASVSIGANASKNVIALVTSASLVRTPPVEA